MMHPEYEILAGDEDGDASLDSLHTGRVVPIYEAAAKVTTRIFRVLLHRILESVAGRWKTRCRATFWIE